MSLSPISTSKLAEIRARIQAQKEAENAAKPLDVPKKSIADILSPEADRYGEDRFGNAIEYNFEQIKAIRLIGDGVSSILLGAAGTGKTTVTKAAISKLVQSGKAGILNPEGHKYLTYGTPGVVCVSFTRRAVMNLRRNMSEDMKANCITIHKLLEYEPVYYEVFDEKIGDTKTTMRFEATRNSFRPLPHTIHTIIIDESSMVSVELFREIQAACPHKPQFVFIGDIQQLPPVFGSAILGFKMLELPTVELIQVYRQALESPIIRLAHRILSGKGISIKEFPEWEFPGKLKLHNWKKKIGQEAALLTFAKFITQHLEHGLYNPQEDIILCPFNKSFGTDEINKHIANHIARRDKKVTYEVIAGFNKHYFSVGDKVLYDKEDAVITKINRNMSYTGIHPQTESEHLDYWGCRQDIASGQVKKTEEEMSEDEVDFMLQQVVSSDDDERVRQASHVIHIRMIDTDKEIIVESAAEINSLIMGYALTVHKSQGSEWRKVYLALHQSHATMLQRELLYTAVTRAKEELYVICEPEAFVKGIESQKIKGNTLAEKAEFFKGKVANGELQRK